jgi:2-polyprenyl-6-methoxyphenol hydroxylase-like FAD-dependent oxidoreductase
VLGGRPHLTRGSARERERRYLEGLRTFPDSLDPRALDTAQLISEVKAVPETLMRGYYRAASGPGWALVGDAGHFKHPATGQGIGDALAQAAYVADDLLAGGRLDGYARWRDDRSDDHYAWSFALAQWPIEEIAGPIYTGIANDQHAAQDFRDSFSRLAPTHQVLSAERLARWHGATSSDAVGQVARNRTRNRGQRRRIRSAS